MRPHRIKLAKKTNSAAHFWGHDKKWAGDLYTSTRKTEIVPVLLLLTVLSKIICHELVYDIFLRIHFINKKFITVALW